MRLTGDESDAPEAGDETPGWEQQVLERNERIAALQAANAAMRLALERTTKALETAHGFVSGVWAGLELDSRAELTAHAVKVKIVEARNAAHLALTLQDPGK